MVLGKRQELWAACVPERTRTINRIRNLSSCLLVVTSMPPFSGSKDQEMSNTSNLVLSSPFRAVCSRHTGCHGLVQVRTTFITTTYYLHSPAPFPFTFFPVSPCQELSQSSPAS